MIANSEQRQVQSVGATESLSFGISQNDVAHVMSILRGQIYSDRVLAVLREYTSNAWDAHREAGIPDKPIRVTLPTLENPTLEVRDFGSGISPEDVAAVFTQYGASTKRSSNSAVGCLGIGSKAGFAYSDSFVVSSRHDGKCRTYVAVLDASERGELRLMDEHGCDDSGVSVQIAVRQQDINEFGQKALELLRFMSPLPEINATLTPLPTLSRHGAVDVTSKQWTALMGCIPYRVDLDHIKVAKFVKEIGGILRFDIGDLNIAASREDLKYTDKTKAALEAKIVALCDEHVEIALREIAAAATPWQRRLGAQSLRCFELRSHLSLTAVAVGFKPPAGIAIRSMRYSNRNDKPRLQNVDEFEVSETARVVIRDDKRALVGFTWTRNDYVVRVDKTSTISVASLEQAVLEMLAGVDCTGLPIVKSSTLPWTAPARKPRKKRAVVARVAAPRAKVLELRHFSYQQGSSNWMTADCTSTASDPYVILDAYKCAEYDQIRADERKLRAFGLEGPKVFGYRRAEKSIVGTPYLEWCKQVDALCLASPKAANIRRALDWKTALSVSVNYHNVARALGEDHEITLLCKKFSTASGIVDPMDDRYLNLVRTLPPSSEAATAKKLVEKLTKRYPLLFKIGLQSLWSGYPDFAVDYVKRHTSRTRGAK